MPYTLHETLCQIDPYVQLTDGQTVSTVAHTLISVDPRDLTEYAMGVDAVGRLVIYRLNLRGYVIRPAAYVEIKPPEQLRFSKILPVDFGAAAIGFV